MGLFNFSEYELITFFAVLVRFSVIFAVLPFTGDRMVPVLVKVFLALVVSVALFPVLISTGQIHVQETAVWASSVGGIIGTIGLEVVYGLILGFVARMSFEAVSFSGNLVGNFMGFAAASTYDPHQESQTQVVAEIQTAIAMLIFLAIDGHHLMLRAALESYRILQIGAGAKAQFGAAFSERLLEITGQVIEFGILIASPVAISLFATNVAFGVIAKSMPQLNIFVLSFAVSALVGLLVMLLSVPEFQGAVENIFGRMSDWMEKIMLAVATGK